MQRLAAVIFFVAVSFLTVPVQAQVVEKPPVPSIAIIDVEKILRESLAVQSARSQIDKIAADLQKQIATEEEMLRSEEKQLQQQRALLTPEVYSERRQALQGRAASLQQRARSLRQALDRGMAQTMQRIQLVLFEEVGKLSEEIGVNLVLPRSQIVVALDSFDISERSLKRLNARLSEVEMEINTNEPGKPAGK
ncbi:MAG: OmpH family outer membrane protein [Proteobacteria bacterium]|nr:OmpH family outer membrane protein [Pseudomonadota bacterium]